MHHGGEGLYPPWCIIYYYEFVLIFCDFLFLMQRRICYGNVTHLNISVTVRDDNRAILGVALDRSDSVYYGCDAGCLDDPVSLSQSYTNFPVKLTTPLTAILYVTSDHQHMQDLRNALHVHAVDEGELYCSFVAIFCIRLTFFRELVRRLA